MTENISLHESGGIAVGDVVRIRQHPDAVGVVSAIIDYGTHVGFFLNLGLPVKFPARREWIEPTGEKID